MIDSVEFLRTSAPFLTAGRTLRALFQSRGGLRKVQSQPGGPGNRGGAGLNPGGPARPLRGRARAGSAQGSQGTRESGAEEPGEPEPEGRPSPGAREPTTVSAPGRRAQFPRARALPGCRGTTRSRGLGDAGGGRRTARAAGRLSHRPPPPAAGSRPRPRRVRSAGARDSGRRPARALPTDSGVGDGGAQRRPPCLAVPRSTASRGRLAHAVKLHFFVTRVLNRPQVFWLRCPLSPSLTAVPLFLSHSWL